MGEEVPNRLREIAKAHGLEVEFPRDVEEQAERLVRENGIDDRALVDLTELPFVTIDGESARDLDQAAFVEKVGDGFRIDYAIADAGYYVRPRTPLFDEALRRGASYYLPGWMIPMLPRVLCEGVVSLNPNVDRRALVFRMSVDRKGLPTGTDIVEARIRSRAKLSFERVQQYLDGRIPTLGSPEIDESARAIETVGRLRMRAAEERDVVRYRRTELKIDREGTRFVATNEVRLPIERYNEQLSLLCNVEGAKAMERRAGDGTLQPIFRVHPPPEPERVRELESLIRDLVELHGLDDSWRWRPREQTLAEYLDSLPDGDGHRGRVARVIHRQAMMINGRSSFRIEPGTHSGIGAPIYARFSAPMREIVGVFLHKEIREQIAGERESEGDDELRERVVEAANRSKEMQRTLTNDANRLVIDQLLAEDLDKPRRERPRRRGVVMGMRYDKVYVQLDEPPIDLKVYVPHLEEALGESLRVADDGTALVSGRGVRFRLGEAVDVIVAGRDRGRDRFVLVLSRVKGEGPSDVRG
jgi:ribonuclease R